MDAEDTDLADEIMRANPEKVCRWLDKQFDKEAARRA